jgi:hypothetical protein
MITPFSLQIETQVLEELQFIASFYLHPEVNVQVRVLIIMRYIGGYIFVVVSQNTSDANSARIKLGTLIFSN